MLMNCQSAANGVLQRTVPGALNDAVSAIVSAAFGSASAAPGPFGSSVIVKLRTAVGVALSTILLLTGIIIEFPLV
jgi:hypothetical protein